MPTLFHIIRCGMIAQCTEETFSTGTSWGVHYLLSEGAAVKETPKVTP